MADLQLIGIGQLHDTAALGHYRRLVGRLGVPAEEALQQAIGITRDRCRSPMQWSGDVNAGFSPPGVDTWLPVHPNHASGVNVADQEAAPGSLLSFYRDLLHLRRVTPALIAGEFQVLHPDNDSCLAFVRYDRSGGQRCLVVLNVSSEEQLLPFDLGGPSTSVRFSSEPRQPRLFDLQGLRVAPFEAIIIEL